MATKKRKTTTRRSTSRKKRAEQRLPAGLGTLFAGLLLVGLAFVEGDSVWKTLHQVLFGLFGCGSFVLGAAVCCLAVLYTRGEDLLPHICKLALGLVFASGTVIVFSDIQPQGLSAFQMVAACYQNGYQAWLSGGALGAVLGGNLLLLCGRPAANFIMLVLALCVSLYIFDLTPAEVWQWLCDVSGGVHAKGVAVYEQGAARRAERRAERQAAQEAADEYDETEELEEYEDEAEAEEPFRLGLPDWMSGVLHWGHKVTQELEQAPDSPAGAPDQPVQPQPEPQAAPAVTPVRVRASRPRAPFDVDLGPDSTEVKEGGSEPIEPFIPGPGGTFGMDPLRAAPKPTIRPIVPDAVETAAEDFFATPEETPAAETTEQQPRPVPGNPFDTLIARPAAPEEPAAAAAPIQPVMPTPQPDQPTRVSAEHAVAQRSDPDADGWISITAEPVEEKDINSLVAAAMEKPAASEQAAATAPAEEAEPVDTYQYQYPPIELFEKSKEESDPNAEDELKANAQKLVDTLESFGVRTRVLDISRGPSVTRYEVQPMAGVKISRITSLADDIALNLAVADVRMEAPIPGKPAVGIEVPNHKRSAVSIRSVFESQSFLRMTSPLGIALGKDIAGVAQVADLCKMPHLLIAGSTGSGKSVCVNSIIMSLVFRSSPEDVKLLLIDPKVVELAEYNGIPHLLIPVVTDPKKASGALNWAVAEMTDRYNKFAKYNVRDMKGYNEKIKSLGVQTEEGDKLEPMPQIIIIVDELADLMMVAPGDVEEAICRLAQLARAAGIHLVLATQRPSVNVITGLIKANMPSRIAFSVSSGVDSRTIIDMNGAEKLLGKGDMLFYPSGYQKPARVQGSFVTDKEVQQVVEYLREHNGDVTYNQDIETHMNTIPTGNPASGSVGSEGNENDAYFADAGRLIIEKEKASIGMLQRAFKIGFNRAARIMDQLCEAGAVGPEEGTKPRKVLMSSEEFEQYLNEKNG